MSACDRIQPLLAESISGELDAGDAVEVRVHLAECAICRAEETEMRGLLALLEHDAAEGLGSGVPDPGGAYWAAFADRVAARTVPRASPARGDVVWLFRRVPGLLAAGLAAAAVLVVALQTPTVKPAVSAEDPRMAELFTQSVALQPAFDLSVLAADDLDRLGAELASASTATPALAPIVEAPRSPAAALDGLDDLSAGQIEKLLEQLDAFET